MVDIAMLVGDDVLATSRTMSIIEALIGAWSRMKQKFMLAAIACSRSKTKPEYRVWLLMSVSTNMKGGECLVITVMAFGQLANEQRGSSCEATYKSQGATLATQSFSTTGRYSREISKSVRFNLQEGIAVE